MKHLLTVSLVAIAILGAGQRANAASSNFECPMPVDASEKPAIADVQRLLPGRVALDDPKQLDAAVDTWRKAGARAPYIIDHLIAAYCPSVISDDALSDAEKTSKIRRFASRITAQVYQLESTDEVIVDIPLPPNTLDAAREMAKIQGIPLDKWLVDAVQAAIIPGN